MKHQSTKKVLAGLMLITIVFGVINIQPKQAHAIPVVVTDVLNDSSYTGLGNFINIWADKIKNYVLDGLAWHIAKMMVQQITASVVSWINSGFQGSPSFLTNPGGYFADLGDQITGNFIANTGILSGLCSPFNVDVRLSLALGQAGYGQVERYTCTLNTIINNVQNSSVTGGASIEGFMAGDFRQGGWPAFIALSEPNNNASGAYLQAHDELLREIVEKQNTVNTQLNQGSGFLSWEDCKNISASDALINAGSSANDAGQLYDSGNQKVSTGAGTSAGGATSIQKKVDPKTGLVSYKSCETKTPGSVINGQLNHVLGSGVDQLNLADSINEIVDALLGQLVNKVLQTGLGGVSQHSSGVTATYIDQLSAEANGSGTISADTKTISAAYAPYIGNAQTTVDLRQQAIDYFQNVRLEYYNAKSCFTTISSSSPNKQSANTALANIDADLSQLYTLEKPYLDKLGSAKDALSAMQKQIQDTSTVAGPNGLQAASDAIQNTINTQPLTLDTAGLNNDAESAKTLANPYDTKANNYIRQCQSFSQN